MRIDVLTLFPEVFEPFVSTSIVGRARQCGLVEVACANYRDFTHDPRRTVDDRPFGGGAGMILMCGPIFEAVEKVTSLHPSEPTLILLTPQGQRLNQAVVEELSSLPRLILLCGRYEGFDERIRTGLKVREISIGDYVLSGGEAAAMAVIDAVVRLLPGALGDEASARDESFTRGTLEYPQYTRPRDFRGMTVPDVLLSGNHSAIDAWRREVSLQRTRDRRPDLLNLEAGPPELVGASCSIWP